MNANAPLGSQSDTPWLQDATHRAWLKEHAVSQFDFFRQCLRAEPGFHVLDFDGNPIADAPQELHSTSRMVHSYALGQAAGLPDNAELVDHGMRYLWEHHRDAARGGYVWGLDENGITEGNKLAYGQVFVLLASASAKLVGHPDADRLMADVTEVIETRYWDDERGLLREEYAQDWSEISAYRGMNANMHFIEATLTAYEVTGDKSYLTKAGRILDFFAGEIAPQYGWRIPEHFTRDWQVDHGFEGNPMFRPAGTTPGHSFEIARLLLQYWDLTGRKDASLVERARKLFDTSVADATDDQRGGFIYTVDTEGKVLRPSRYWWPVTEAIGTAAAFLKLEWSAPDEALYRKQWRFAHDHLIDHDKGGWFPELDAANKRASTQFQGKPDIYHSIQATLFPLSPKLSSIAGSLSEVSACGRDLRFT